MYIRHAKNGRSLKITSTDPLKHNLFLSLLVLKLAGCPKKIKMENNKYRKCQNIFIYYHLIIYRILLKFKLKTKYVKKCTDLVLLHYHLHLLRSFQHTLLNIIYLIKAGLNIVLENNSRIINPPPFIINTPIMFVGFSPGPLNLNV